MRRLLLCSQNPLFRKSVYGLLRDDGFAVETAEHPAEAVRAVLHQAFDTVVVDSRDIGLKAAEAAGIIRKLHPETVVVVLGEPGQRKDRITLGQPFELDHFRNLINRIIHHQEGGIHDTERDYSHGL